MFLIFSYRVNMNLMSVLQWFGTLIYKVAVLGKMGPGTNVLSSPWLLTRFALYRRLQELPGAQIFNALLGDTAIGRWGLRVSGVTTGFDVFATGLTCHTPDALILGDYMCSGGQSVASCINNEGIVRPITLGMGTTLGNHTLLFPGATIGVGCILGSSTYVKADQHVPANTRLQGSVVYHVDPSADLEILAEAAQEAMLDTRVYTCTGPAMREMWREIFEVLCKFMFYNSNVDVQWGIIIIPLIYMMVELGYGSIPIYFAILPASTLVAVLWLRVLSWVLGVEAGWRSGSASVWTIRAKMSSGVVAPMTEALIKPFLGTPLVHPLLWGMGGKVGRGTIVMGGVPTEVALLEIGKYAVLDQNCETLGHYLTNQKFTYISVKVGDQAWIGSCSRVQAGAVMQERSRLLPGSNVLPGETLQSGSIWAGIPAAPVR